MELKKYNIDCSQEKTRPVYAKRYKKNGEVYLKKIDDIDIVEDMKEKQLEINRIKEIFNIQERLKAEELLDDMTNEDFLEQLKEINETSEMDTYDFLNKTIELKEIYNKMPEKIRLEYKNLARFGKEYIPKLIKETEEKLTEKQILKQEQEKQQTIQQTNEQLQQQIQDLQKQLKGEQENV